MEIHTLRFLPIDAPDRIENETTGNGRGSCHLPEIGTLAIHHFTLHNYFLVIVFPCDKMQSPRNFLTSSKGYDKMKFPRIIRIAPIE